MTEYLQHIYPSRVIGALADWIYAGRYGEPVIPKWNSLPFLDPQFRINYEHLQRHTSGEDGPAPEVLSLATDQRAIAFALSLCAAKEKATRTRPA
jgi:hypothetical protein